MSYFCHPLPECSLRLAGLKGKPLLAPAAPQAVGPESLAEKTLVVKIPFTQDFLRTQSRPQWRKEALADSTLVQEFRINSGHC